MRTDTTMVLGIGAPRAGTTWLATYLEHHPQFYMSPLKEMHYFDAKFLPDCCAYFNHVFIHALLTTERQTPQVEHLRMRVDMIDDPSLYLRYFERFTKDECCFGEISPSYSLLDCAMIQEITALHPKTKFIYILRNPIDRFISNAFYMVNSLDFDLRYPDSYVCSCLKSNHLLLRANYRKAILEYDKAAAGDILYVFYEQLFCDASLRRLCDFCGIDFYSAPYATRVNATASRFVTQLREATRRSVYRVLREQYAFVRDYRHGDIPPNWLEDMARFDD